MAVEAAFRRRGASRPAPPGPPVPAPRARGGPTEPPRSDAGGPRWCSLRFRFDEEERLLLRAAERLQGHRLARQPGPAALRTALALAKAGRQVAAAPPGAAASLSQADAALLREAVVLAAEEVRWLAEQPPDPPTQPPGRSAAERLQAITAAFPSLTQQGAWRAFGIRRALEALAARLSEPLGSPR